jgi:hypothetical protein
MTDPNVQHIQYENELAASRLQGLLLTNGLWLLVYMQRLDLPGIRPPAVLQLQANAKQQGLDSLALARATAQMDSAYLKARVGLSIVGGLTTLLYAAALWYGLAHINQYWKRLKGALPPDENRLVARSHYYLVPVCVGLFWVYLGFGEASGYVVTGMAILLLAFFIVFWIINRILVDGISTHLFP